MVLLRDSLEQNLDTLDTDNKRLHGQFFTVTNPFSCNSFFEWLKSIPKWDKATYLEPFAGSNNIVSMLRSLDRDNPWACFDIEPPAIEDPESPPVVRRDTLLDYPTGYSVAITNPPYLAKNSATRRGLNFPETQYDDLYKLALHVMLENTPYVAAIIPESFITQSLFLDRLHSVESLTCKMFDDTEVPVCLAMFVPADTKAQPTDFSIYASDQLIGTYSQLREFIDFQQPVRSLSLRFNEPSGQIGLKAIDGNIRASICFLPGSEIDSSDVKVTSRSKTRIGVEGLSTQQVQKLIAEANRILEVRREKTSDVFMTAFKGLRRDGRYRRRLDFAQARNILLMHCK